MTSSRSPSRANPAATGTHDTMRRVQEVMAAARIAGIHATPKGLRHGFGIKAVSKQVPLNMVQKWLGHAHIATTSIYAAAVGPEAKQLAQRMWP